MAVFQSLDRRPPAPQPPSAGRNDPPGFPSGRVHNPPSLSGTLAMAPSERFLKCAADCNSMAVGSGDLNSRSVWRSLAERWARCAEWAEKQRLAAEKVHAHKRNRERARPGGGARVMAD